METCPHDIHIIAKNGRKFKRFALVLKNRKIFTPWKTMWTGCLPRVEKKEGVDRKKQAFGGRERGEEKGGRPFHKKEKVWKKRSTIPTGS
ncbi:MAG TPA: hypothetical protein H9676_04150 [Firmicutes bacterium]|nr:hypothetical protein [Bacillota bacterium]